MPKLTGPLFSITASGTISNLLNYRHTKRGTIGRVNSKPTGDPTTVQLSIRSITKQVSQAWAIVSLEDRATWQQLATYHKYSPFNAFFVENFKRVSTGQEITNVYPPSQIEGFSSVDIINGDPESDPDVSGNYVPAGVTNDQIEYQRSEPVEARLWFDGFFWKITLVADGYETDNNFSGEETIDGVYEGGGDFTGFVSGSPNP